MARVGDAQSSKKQLKRWHAPGDLLKVTVVNRDKKNEREIQTLPE